jgi:hypothetical protein
MQSWRKSYFCLCSLVLIGCAVVFSRPQTSRAQTIVNDPIDAVAHLTDEWRDGAYLHEGLVLPDVVQLRLGNFAPANPYLDRFAGSFVTAGAFMRFDVVFHGLINPPGTVNIAPEGQTYDPLRYGPSPVFGFIEFDVDRDVNTGGELDFPELRYPTVSARFGGKSSEPRFWDRIARDASDCDHDVSTPPYVDRSGEEFHLALYGEHIESIDVLVERANGVAGTFEAGETWILTGPLFHRAHGFEDFAFKCLGPKGAYMPIVQLRWSHDVTLDLTTVSLVYPLTNAASAALLGPGVPPETNNGCADQQNSIAEGLDDLVFSASNPKPGDISNPEFQLLAGWAGRNINNYLTPDTYRIALALGTSYPVQVEEATYIWTDIWPNVRPGDYDGSGCIDQGDTLALAGFISERDGQMGYDYDGEVDGNVTLMPHRDNFCIYDGSDNSVTNNQDEIILGDLNMNHAMDMADVVDFVEALLEPAQYKALHGGVEGWVYGDLNCDAKIDALDIQPFIDHLLHIQ